MPGFRKVKSEESRTAPHHIVSINGRCSIRKLAQLRQNSIPQLDLIIDAISRSTGLHSEYNEKKDKAAKAKVNRPDIKVNKPWMTLAHLRDYLRFRTYLDKLDDFVAVLNVMLALEKNGDLSIVKVDTAKLLNPSEFGWRMIAIDIRLPSGMLVEHYMTFGDLIHVNNDWLHAVYERWRNQPITNFGNARRRSRDAEFSTLAYRELFNARLLAERPAFNRQAALRNKTDTAFSRAIARRLAL